MTLLLGQHANAQTLADAIADAYRTNPTLASSRYDLRATDEQMAQARSELRPTAELNVTGSYDRSISGRLTRASNPFGPGSSAGNGNQSQLTIEQPLFTGGRATSDIQIAEANIRAQREVLRGAEGDLLLGVITAYVDVRCYRSILASWQENVESLGQLVKEIEARQVAGELTRTDIAQARNQLQVAREEVVTTQQQVEAALSDFYALVGRQAGILAEEPPLPQLPASASDAYVLAERQNPELRQAVYTEMASRDGIALAKSAGHPTLSVRGSATLGGRALPYSLRNQDQGYTGSLVLSVPLMQGGRVASEIRQAEDKNGSDRFKIEVERRAVDRSVANAWNQMIAATRTSALVEAQRAAAATQLEGMIAEYRVGLRSTFDVLYAQQQLTQAAIAQLSARRDRYVAEASLLRQTGLLEVEAIMTGVALHDPSAHLRAIEDRDVAPLDGIVAIFDRAGAPRVHQKRLVLPAMSQGQPRLAVSDRNYTSDLPFAPPPPLSPAPGTIGHPISSVELPQ